MKIQLLVTWREYPPVKRECSFQFQIKGNAFLKIQSDKLSQVSFLQSSLFTCDFSHRRCALIYTVTFCLCLSVSSISLSVSSLSPSRSNGLKQSMAHSKAYRLQLNLTEDGLDPINSSITVINNLILSHTQEITMFCLILISATSKRTKIIYMSRWKGHDLQFIQSIRCDRFRSIVG